MHGWQLSSNHIERKGSFAGFIPARELFFYKKLKKRALRKEEKEAILTASYSCNENYKWGNNSGGKHEQKKLGKNF